ncbi:MAG TPA: hypothetical protein VJU84_08825 [Pyrinomonadaceae bacterium]|nr:hypothetical protein [Pyrinomonadaceae bacterium]
MEDRKQKAEGRRQEPIKKDQWVELCRRLLARPSVAAAFSSEERRAVNGFINFVADDVEKVQKKC